MVKWNNEFYIIPESEAANRIGLYRAKDFPFSWEYVQTLVEGLFGDHSLFRYQESWWLLAGPGARLRSGLRLFYADELTGPWIEHPKSPVVRNDSGRARPGGRTLVLGNTIVRYAQDCAPTYGRALNAFEITALTKTDYRERPVASNPVLQPGNSPWTMHGIHQLDAHELREGEWIACVDGYKRRLTLAVEY
ncbi:MAG: hypothetical protein DME19_07660 [Verrucomicrobia bacterium]|nr:MAG: hypothetical protein DME19_07660 [Verrucomicrobiota bacterium]